MFIHKFRIAMFHQDLNQSSQFFGILRLKFYQFRLGHWNRGKKKYWWWRDSLLKFKIFHGFQSDFLHEGINQNLLTYRGLQNWKTMDFAPSAEILVIENGQKQLSCSFCWLIEFFKLQFLQKDWLDLIEQDPKRQCFLRKCFRPDSQISSLKQNCLSPRTSKTLLLYISEFNFIFLFEYWLHCFHQCISQ